MLTTTKALKTWTITGPDCNGDPSTCILAIVETADWTEDADDQRYSLLQEVDGADLEEWSGCDDLEALVEEAEALARLRQEEFDDQQAELDAANATDAVADLVAAGKALDVLAALRAAGLIK